MNTERSLSNEETRVKERALRGEIVLISPQGLKALDVQIEAVRQEVDVKTLELGLVAQQDTDLPENLGFKETKTHIQTTLAVKLHTLREMKAKSIPYWTKHENLVDFGTIFDAEVSVGDYIDSNRYILLGPAESLYVDMSKIGLTVWNLDNDWARLKSKEWKK